MSITIGRTVELAMGHRLRNHPGACKNYHGHNYLITVEVTGEVDSQSGMVLDFADLKTFMKDVLEPFNHAMVVHKDDPYMKWEGKTKSFAVPFEPTAENLMIFWQENFEALLPQDLSVHVVVRETSDTLAFEELSR